MGEAIAGTHQHTVASMALMPGKTFTKAQDVPFLFLHLPLEIRVLIYELLVSNTTCITVQEEWRHGVCIFGGKVDVAANPLGLRVAKPVGLQTASALMKTCRTTDSELAPSIYTRLTLHVWGFPQLQDFQLRLRPSSRHMIPKLRVYQGLGSAMPITSTMRGLMAGYPALRELQIDCVDRTADDDIKGTKWKPRVLRGLAAAMAHNEQLCKVFYTLNASYRDHPKPMSVRLFGVNDTAQPRELELDVDAEYNKWLAKRRERRR